MAAASQGRTIQDPWMSSLPAPLKATAACQIEPEGQKKRQRSVDGAHDRGQEKSSITASKVPAAGGPMFTIKWGDEVIISRPRSEIPRGVQKCPAFFSRLVMLSVPCISTSVGAAAHLSRVSILPPSCPLLAQG